MAPHASTVFLILSSMLLVSTTMAYSSNYLDSIGVFAERFFKEAKNQPKNKGKNIVISALSADIVMSMVAFGAEKETKKEITDVLDIENVDSITPQIQKTLSDLKKESGVVISLANKAYFRPSTNGNTNTIAPAFRANIQDNFGSEVELLDFSKSHEAAGVINNWVEGKTNHLIKGLVSEDSLSDATVAVLVNAIYFKGTWQTPFDNYLTSKANFTKSDGSTVEVDMMRNLANFKYAELKELDAKVVLLPYKGSEAAMVIILPNKPDKINELEDKVKGGLNKYVDHLTLQSVRLGIPKFKIETSINVKDALQKLGCNRVFNVDAQLTKIMSSQESLSITEAVQKATVEINESGTEASAATLALAGRRSGRYESVVTFEASHSFLFGILNTPGIELFRGAFRGSQ